MPLGLNAIDETDARLDQRNEVGSVAGRDHSHATRRAWEVVLGVEPDLITVAKGVAGVAKSRKW